LRPFEEKLEVVFVRNGPTSDFWDSGKF
jgi:hypothetical protein